MARRPPVFILTDLDRKACPGLLLDDWLGKPRGDSSTLAQFGQDAVPSAGVGMAAAGWRGETRLLRRKMYLIDSVGFTLCVP